METSISVFHFVQLQGGSAHFSFGRFIKVHLDNTDPAHRRRESVGVGRGGQGRGFPPPLPAALQVKR